MYTPQHPAMCNEEQTADCRNRGGYDLKDPCRNTCMNTGSPKVAKLIDLREVKGSMFDLGDLNVHDGAGTIFAPTGNDYVKAGKVTAKKGGSVVFMGGLQDLYEEAADQLFL
mmetsp:Transcript_19261/g.32818  ORF Transcript_19261/g.32818 Transcript_19261/m.32818 type:complete len:112 (-) Transcript_19261:47-382(-)